MGNNDDETYIKELEIWENEGGSYDRKTNLFLGRSIFG